MVILIVPTLGPSFPKVSFIKTGMLTGVSSLVIAESSLAGGVVDGSMYGINLGNNSEVFTLDVDAFEAAGVELPAVDWTWADFEEIAMALHEELGIYGIMTITSDPEKLI